MEFCVPGLTAGILFFLFYFFPFIAKLYSPVCSSVPGCKPKAQDCNKGQGRAKKEGITLLYNNHLNTRLVRYSNGQKVSGLQMVRYSNG